MASLLSALVLSLAASPLISASPIVNTTSPTVKLDYGTFVGAQDTTYNLTYYRKIPFAASTAGQNRFRAPQPPQKINGTYDTNQPFDMCPQRTVNGSEDCLYLGVYSRPWSRPRQLRPVLLTFYGGGFIQGSATFTIPPSGYPVLNASDANDYVVVYSNYRTNVFGFLAGAKVAKHPKVDLNNGLLDQQAALKWIQKNIHHFGGDKANVTIWGQSAGGGSVIAQTIATGNRGKKLFRKAMASSPFWPKTYRYDSPEAEKLYKEIVDGVGCAGKEDEIQCLKSADLQTLRDVNLKLTTSQQYTTSTFTWGPFIDDKFLTQGLASTINDAKLNADVVLSGYNLHEGENFIPPGFQSTAGSNGFNSSTASFDSWLTGFLPGFGPNELDEVRKLYPVSGVAEEIKWNTTWERAGLVYRDLILACPAYWLVKKADKGWLIEYTIDPAKHASDTIYWNTLNAVQKSDPLTYQGFAGAMASFVQTGDPNVHKVTNESVVGLPEIEQGQQFVIRKNGLANGKTDLLEERCAFWLKEAEKIPI
ncbi:Alpha/Beta hydrolase protein [Dendryphion nanum]|uniref:Carboxylic ester hydrolase n=1 Tax=Dendryphion nanum TaxID=256645 RepID=A0A9P9DW68_9PLEO|nr:Alpha/Beta hydrolase protein [Dendryphion nanum]